MRYPNYSKEGLMELERQRTGNYGTDFDDGDEDDEDYDED